MSARGWSRTSHATARSPPANLRPQRPRDLTEAIDSVAERLPFADQQFDASKATFTAHQRSDLGAGIRELRCVPRGPIVIMAPDPERLHDFWLPEYFSEVLDRDRTRFPRIDTLVELLGADRG